MVLASQLASPPQPRPTLLPPTMPFACLLSMEKV